MSVLSFLRQAPVRLYLLGHALIVLGAWLMGVTHSMWPMALAASAAILLAMPLLRNLTARFKRRS